MFDAATSHAEPQADPPPGGVADRAPGDLLLAAFQSARGTDSSDPVAVDPLTVATFELAISAANSDATILIGGPTGSGKEVLARLVHERSRRRVRPFVAVNVAALPDAMAEALLFGHERGAYTGAHAAAPGLMRAADGGTLFLDEVGELSPAVQAKLLRALQDRSVLPLGATEPVPVDCRIVAATHRDLAAEVTAGRFRADLYWRLAVFPLSMPPLVRRPGDLPALCARLLARSGCATTGISGPALARLAAHDWPGNVRELDNVLQRAAVLAGGGTIEPVHLRFDAGPCATAPAAGPSPLAAWRTSREQERIRDELAAGGTRREAARRLGISERTLRYKLAAMSGRPRPAAGIAMARA